MSRNLVVEGVEYNQDNSSFSFDFSIDSEKSIVKLNQQIYRLKEYLPCTYFGYVFDDSVDKKIKPVFIDALKFPNRSGYAKIKREDLERFINRSISLLNDEVDLSKYDIIIYPESRSKLNELVLDKITRYSFSSKYQTFKIVKELPKNIDFDFRKYFAIRHTMDKDKPLVEANIRNFMKKIHNLDYISLGKDVQPKYRRYLRNFFTFASKKDKEAFEDLNDEKRILIIDDIVTTGSTLEYVLNAIRTVNNIKDSKICIFSILGNRL